MLHMACLLHMNEWHFLCLDLLKLIFLDYKQFFIKFCSLFHDDSHLDYVCQMRFATILLNLEGHFLRLDLGLLCHAAEFNELCDQYEVGYRPAKCLKSDLRLVVLEMMLH